jgi:hypothetical protein
MRRRGKYRCSTDESDARRGRDGRASAGVAVNSSTVPADSTKSVDYVVQPSSSGQDKILRAAREDIITGILEGVRSQYGVGGIDTSIIEGLRSRYGVGDTKPAGNEDD